MHYIIGTRILFTRTKIRPGLTSSGMKTVKKPLEFDYDTMYSLYNIKKVDDKFVYSFQSDNQDIVTIEFDTISDADKYIARLKDQVLPDYNAVYSRNTG
mgnify:CR=1 FL=1|tara:strand:- start:1539 stop:1835 length:297 start_codon:yes stop_codon:yes gene_type:complete